MQEQDVLEDIPVTFTEGAITELQRLQKENTEKKLRVGVKGGGCSGMTYVLEFDETKEGDKEYIVNDLCIVMNKSHDLYLHGIEIDYSSGLNARGFTFKNPNASSTCGCGTSFAV